MPSLVLISDLDAVSYLTFPENKSEEGTVLHILYKDLLRQKKANGLRYRAEPEGGLPLPCVYYPTTTHA